MEGVVGGKSRSFYRRCIVPYRAALNSRVVEMSSVVSRFPVVQFPVLIFFPGVRSLDFRDPFGSGV